MKHKELQELFASQAHWRAEVATRFPDDRERNEDAAKIFERLAETAADVPQSLLDAYGAVFLRWVTDDVVRTEQEMLKSVGFRIAPENAEVYPRSFLDLVAFENRRKVYRPTSISS
jgi:hypothetical protein